MRVIMTCRSCVKLSWCTLFNCAFLLHIITIARAQNPAPVIQNNPSSLLVPLGHTAVFECTIQNCGELQCDVYWIINGTSTAHQQQRFEDKGFAFFDDGASSIYTARLSVRSSLAVNNTQICCLIQHALHTSIKSTQATLLVISEAMLSPNPSVTTYCAHNSTYFILEWSPPYLWPGKHIEYFNVSVRNASDLSITNYHRVNTTFDEAVVSLALNFDDLRTTCTELQFDVFAVTGSVQLPSSYSITKRYQPPPAEFNLTDIEITVLFTATARPFVTVNIKLPSPICVHQKLNYTIIIDDINGTNSTQNYGPFQHTGPGTIGHDIDRGLERNREYSARVTVLMLSYVITSHEIHFGHEGYIFDYKVAMGITLSVAILILMALTVVLILVCIRKQRQLQQKAGVGDDRTMVHNPIYDQAAGPEYESVIQSFTFSKTNENGATCLDHAQTTCQPCSDMDQGHRSFGTSDNYIVMSPSDVLTDNQTDVMGDLMSQY